MGIIYLKGGDPINLWYSISEGEWICVGHGRCKRVDLTLVHGSNGLKNYIVVVVEFIFQWFQNLKLLFLDLYGRFVGDCVELYCFWLVKHVSWLGGR
jgi:hypothetical protein